MRLGRAVLCSGVRKRSPVQKLLALESTTKLTIKGSPVAEAASAMISASGPALIISARKNRLFREPRSVKAVFAPKLALAGHEMGR